MTTLATAVGLTLADSGVRHCFGVVGNGNIVAAAAMIAGGINYVQARHEGGAMAMADGYYRTTGEVAVCTVTYGPGLTNTATALADAVKHRSGVLVLCGDGPVSGPRLIDIDQMTFAESLGARVVRLTSPETACVQTAQALQLARTEPGPVLVYLPADLLSVPVAAGSADVADAEVTRPGPEPTEIDAILDALAGAHRPLVLAGLGAWRSGAGKALADLGDSIGALFTTSLMAVGMFSDNAWSLGICGGFASPASARLIGEADIVLAFGASLNDWTLHGGQLIDPTATVVQVILPGSRPSPRSDLVVNGDATVAAAAIRDGVDARALAPSGWRGQAAVHSVGWAHEPYQDAGTSQRLDPRTLTRALLPLLPIDRTLVMDGGHFTGWPAMYWPVADPAAFVFTGAAFQTIGLGFAGAVGAAVGRPDRTVVLAVGDGGGLMGLADLETLIRVARSALVVVYDDAAYSVEVHLYRDLGVDVRTALFDRDTDFAGVARSLGACATTARTTDDLEPLRAWIQRGRPGTFVLDCKVAPEVIAQYLAELAGVIRVSSTAH